MEHYGSTEESTMKYGRAAVFEADFEIFVFNFKTVREAKKPLQRCGSIFRSLYCTIICIKSKINDIKSSYNCSM